MRSWLRVASWTAAKTVATTKEMIAAAAPVETFEVTYKGRTQEKSMRRRVEECIQSSTCGALGKLLHNQKGDILITQASWWETELSHTELARAPSRIVSEHRLFWRGGLPCFTIFYLQV